MSVRFQDDASSAGDSAAALNDADYVSSDPPSSSPRHASSPSAGDFVVAPSPTPEDQLEASPDATRPTRPVTISYTGAPFHKSLKLFVSTDGFEHPVEMREAASEGGWTATVTAPVGQDLLYRFEIDGEMQASDEAPIMQLNGEEFNVLPVVDESAAAAASASSESASKGSSPQKDDKQPHYHRRQSSKLVWDTRRKSVMIRAVNREDSDEDDTNKTPARRHSGADAAERFVDVTGGSGDHTVPQTLLHSPTASSAAGDSGDEDDDASAAASGGLTRTQRKNLKHREKAAKQKQAEREWQSSHTASGFPIQPTPQAHSVPQGGQSGGNGMPFNNHGAMMLIQQLQMEALRKENQWKQNWIAHELQSAQQRAQERAVLKAQMDQERGQWLSKLKTSTAEAKALREENEKLKAEVSAAASSKRLEKATVRRSEKFQTMQRNVLKDEMAVWLSEKKKLEEQIATAQAQVDASAKELEELRAAQHTSVNQLNMLGVLLDNKNAELTTLAAEKEDLVKQQALGAQNSEESVKRLQEQLAAAQAKHGEESRAANQARGEVQLLQATLAGVKEDLAAKGAELEAQKAAAAAKLQAQETATAALKVEMAALQKKQSQTQEALFHAETALEQSGINLEAAEQRVTEVEAAAAAKQKGLEDELALARAGAADAGSKIVALSQNVRDLREQSTSLAQLQLSQTQSFLKQLGDAQTFLVEALQVQSGLLQTTMRKLKKEMSERRKLHNQVQELRGNIRVYCRTRPLTAAEIARAGSPEQASAITVQESLNEDEVSTELSLRMEKGPPKLFEFDAVFGPKSTQSEVFTQIVSLVTSVLDGYSCCLFAYGQTGAGKTHTMSGTPENPGMNLRSLTELFRLREERKEDVDYEIKVSSYEIYNENLFDLLDPSDRELKIRQGPTGVYVEGLTERPVQSEADVLALMAEAAKNRTVGATSMNAQSSRSHSILSVHVHGHSHTLGMQLRGTLHLIDLAGSERVGRSNATGDRLKEAQAINLSLSSLGNVIEALQKKQAHVPYRNSKLTFILSGSLGGHSKCLMMVNCSPAVADAEETACSLQFASRVRATELGTASKNVTTSAPGHASTPSTDAAAAPPSAEKAAPAATPRRPGTASAAAAGSAVKPRAAVSATPVKKPAAAAGSAVKKLAAK